jgi:hypothetical protein
VDTVKVVAYTTVRMGDQVRVVLKVEREVPQRKAIVVD